MLVGFDTFFNTRTVLGWCQRLFSQFDGSGFKRFSCLPSHSSSKLTCMYVWTLIGTLNTVLTIDLRTLSRFDSLRRPVLSASFINGSI